MKPGQLSRRRMSLVGLTVLSIAVIFYNLGANSMHNRDEAEYALISEDVLRTGDWLTLHYDGHPFFNKAPLRFWLTAATYKLFGVSELTARFWSAAFAVGTILLLYGLGARIFDPRTALLASLLLLTSTQFLYNHGAKSGELDTVYLFFWVASLLLFLRSKSRKLYFYLACLALGLVGMSKHLLLIVPIVVIVVLHMWCVGGWRTFSLRTWFSGAGIVIAVSVPWHLAQWILHGESFTNIYFVQQTYDRAVNWGVPYTPSSYWVTIKDGFFPWSILAALSVAAVFTKIGRSRYQPNLLLLIWMGTVLVTCISASGKFPWYILPVYPALAFLTAQLIWSFVEGRQGPWMEAGIVLAILVSLTMTSMAGEDNPFARHAFEGVIGVEPSPWVRGLWDMHGTLFIAAAAVLAISVLVGWRVLATSHRASTFVRSARYVMTAYLFVWTIYNAVVPLRHSEHKSDFHRITQDATERLDTSSSTSKRLLVALGGLTSSPIVSYYLRRLPHEPRVVSTEELLQEGASLLESHTLILAHVPVFVRLERQSGLLGRLRVLTTRGEYVLAEIVGLGIP